jgi:hypothetical protein
VKKIKKNERTTKKYEKKKETKEINKHKGISKKRY